MTPLNVVLVFCLLETVSVNSRNSDNSVRKRRQIDECKTQKNCYMIKRDRWTCNHSNCRYNYTAGLCEPRNPACKIKCPLSKQHNKAELQTKIDQQNKIEQQIPSLELVFLLDSTLSPPPSESIVFDNYVNLYIKAVDALKTVFKDSKFGLSLYSDWSCHDWTRDGPCKPYKNGQIEHDDPEGCYRHQQSLTDNVSNFKTNTKRDSLTIRHSEMKEPALNGVMHAAEDRKMKWSTGDSKKVTKVIVVVTNNGLHTLTPFYMKHTNKTKPKFDGTDTCSKMIHPDIPDLDKFLIKDGFILFFILKDDDGVKKSFKEVLDTMKTPWEYVGMEEDIAVIESKLLKFILKENKITL